ncbi:hypothetical protein CUMW_107190 [Citrus unshiu]|nr:hypothetical protein CUMW_107190 [Citrus unshiu]
MEGRDCEGTLRPAQSPRMRISAICWCVAWCCQSPICKELDLFPVDRNKFSLTRSMNSSMHSPQGRYSSIGQLRHANYSNATIHMLM